jgi:hypothetical protein
MRRLQPSDFGQQPLKAAAVFGTLAAEPLVLVDHQHTIGRPAQLLRQLSEPVLPLPGLAVFQHLIR